MYMCIYRCKYMDILTRERRYRDAHLHGALYVYIDINTKICTYIFGLNPRTGRCFAGAYSRANLVRLMDTYISKVNVFTDG